MLAWALSAGCAFGSAWRLTHSPSHVALTILEGNGDEFKILMMTSELRAFTGRRNSPDWSASVPRLYEPRIFGVNV